MIYLDAAATTLQKPADVSRAMCAAMRRSSSPGRGGHPWGMEANQIVFRCREAAAGLFHVPEPEQIVFTCNATHALNIAIRSLVRPGGTVLISGYEHNAVTRTLHAVAQLKCRVALSQPFDSEGMLQAFQTELERGVDLVVCTHVSNVFGFILPITELAQMCRRHHVPLIVDASQSAGCVPIDFTALGAEFVACPGHKGLYGPQGTGILMCGGSTMPLLFGGTGSRSVQQTMPDFLPDRLEAGTPNVPGIAGLAAGIGFVSKMGVENIATYERKLIFSLVRQLQRIPGIKVFAAQDRTRQSGVLSVEMEEKDCEGVGEWLANHGVGVRAGLHCAPIAHQTAGTLEKGTVRFSVSAFNTMDEIYTVSRLMRQMCLEVKGK